jgi:hypothetical protein
MDKPTIKTVAWCEAHEDWGRDAYLTPDGAIAGLRDIIRYPDGTWTDTEAAPFTSRRKLRAWAGY